MSKIEDNSQDKNTSSDEEEEDEEAKVFIYKLIFNYIYR